MPAERLRAACVQMDMRLGDADGNFAHAEELVRAAVEREHPDVVVLPETWNTGFFPEDLSACADRDGMRTKETFSRLAKELHVHVVAGSVADRRDGRFYNTAYVFDRTGALVTSYDKTHAFTPMGEQLAFAQGDALCRFSLEGHDCGLIICYDIRFPELTRTLALQGMDLLFVVSQWPAKRSLHLQTLSRARAIENQMFLALCNSCGSAGETQYGGGSALIDPWGETLAQAGEKEEMIAAAKAVHAHGFIKRLPKGYDTIIGGEGSLSEGQKQLLCVARVMICRPPMLILDEATSNIDTRTEKLVQDAFAKLMEGRTCFIVAHRLSTIQNADVILVMNAGRIVEQGTHEQLLKKGGFYAQLYQAQF